jgi:tetratricopeptide (TPR) repeat protein
MVQAPAVKGDVNALLAKAKILEATADSKEKVQQMIAAYEDVLKIDPQNLQAFTSLGQYYFMMAYAYSEYRKDKKTNYLKALQYNEKVLYIDPEFKLLADKGEKIWEACRVIKKDKIGAMYFWYLSLGNCWNECFNTLERLCTIFWAGRNKKMLDRMEELDPQWGSGRIYFALAAYYTITPGMFGGDMKKAEDYFNKALALGPHMSNFYYARALYYQTKKKDRNGFIADLHHTLAIDPRQADTLPYPWAVWYQVKAKQLLKDTNKYFK